MANILQWNCRGLRTRAEELKVLIKDHDPKIICLQETKLGEESYNPGLNYSFYRSPPPTGDQAKDSAAIIAHKSIRHLHYPLQTSLQAVAVRFTLEKQFTVCSIYLPPEPDFTNHEIQSLIDQLPTPFLLLGDFNAHNPLWGGLSTTPEGRIIEDIIDNNDILLSNDGSMTYHDIHSNRKSAIDLSLCSREIHLDYTWNVDEYLHGSDHYPIHLRPIVNIPTECPPKWKTNEADWTKFNQDINLDREFESFESHIDAYNYLVDATLQSANSSIPKTKGKPRRPAVPWWNKTCGILRKVTRKCYRVYKNSGTPTNKTIYQ